MSGAMPVRDFPRPIVEHRLHARDLFARELSKPRALGKELVQQAIGVLVRPSLPGTMRMGKVDPHLFLLGKEAISLSHPLPVVYIEMPVTDELLEGVTSCASPVPVRRQTTRRAWGRENLYEPVDASGRHTSSGEDTFQLCNCQ
jgi:hypothetical protein